MKSFSRDIPLNQIGAIEAKKCYLWIKICFIKTQVIEFIRVQHVLFTQQYFVFNVSFLLFLTFFAACELSIDGSVARARIRSRRGTCINSWTSVSTGAVGLVQSNWLPSLDPTSIRESLLSCNWVKLRLSFFGKVPSLDKRYRNMHTFSIDYQSCCTLREYQEINLPWYNCIVGKVVLVVPIELSHLEW